MALTGLRGVLLGLVAAAFIGQGLYAYHLGRASNAAKVVAAEKVRDAALDANKSANKTISDLRAANAKVTACAVVPDADAVTAARQSASDATARANTLAAQLAALRKAYESDSHWAGEPVPDSVARGLRAGAGGQTHDH